MPDRPTPGPAAGQVVIASPDGAVSHLALFKVATREYLGHRVKPLFMPKPLCGPGIRVRDLLGRVLGERPFERTWMAEYIDQQMTVNAAWSRRSSAGSLGRASRSCGACLS